MKGSILQHSAFFIVQFSQSYMTTGKTIALTRRTFVGKVMSLLFNTLSLSPISFPYICLNLVCLPKNARSFSFVLSLPFKPVVFSAKLLSKPQFITRYSVCMRPAHVHSPVFLFLIGLLLVKLMKLKAEWGNFSLGSENLFSNYLLLWSSGAVCSGQ